MKNGVIISMSIEAC